MGRFAISIGAFLIPGAAAAHPEHVSGGGFGLVHYLTDPFHVALLGVAALLCVVAGRSLVRSRAVSRSTR